MPESKRNRKACPCCGNIEEEPYDYDLQGNDIFVCGPCGATWSAAEGSEERTLIYAD